MFLISCESSDDAGTPVITNEDPTVPKLVFPTNELTCTSVQLEFLWSAATDADGDTVSYSIDVSTQNDFETVAFTATTDQPSRTFDLEKGVTYFWRVKAKDSRGNESDYATTQSFFTEPEAAVNSLPNTPELVSPTLGARTSGTTITLDWNATDIDNDTLVYDVYFGDTNPPALFSENINTTTFDVSVSSGKVYYWRIVVKDPHQSATMGQVWNFRTE